LNKKAVNKLLVKLATAFHVLPSLKEKGPFQTTADGSKAKS